MLPDVPSSVVQRELSVQEVHQSYSCKSTCKQTDRQGTFLANYRCRGARKPAQIFCDIFFCTNGFEINLVWMKFIAAISLSYYKRQQLRGWCSCNTVSGDGHGRFNENETRL